MANEATEILSVSRQNDPEVYGEAVTFLADEWGYEGLERRWITDVPGIPGWTRASAVAEDEEIVAVLAMDVSEMRPDSKRISGEIYGAVGVECTDPDIVARLLQATVAQFENDPEFEGRQVAFVFSIGTKEDPPLGIDLAFHVATIPNTWDPGDNTVIAYIRPPR